MNTRKQAARAASIQGMNEDHLALSRRFIGMRQRTESLCAELETEDYVIQAGPDASPPKWHLAHTSWFFERFVLRAAKPDRKPFQPAFDYLFNSYYEGAGSFFDRPRRGTLARPTVREVLRYRAFVNEGILEFLQRPSDAEWAQRIELGINHEQQHQELLLTDMKFNAWCNPLRPAMLQGRHASLLSASSPPLRWISFPGGLTDTGSSGSGFTFDNERPAHRVYLAPFSLASRLVSNAEYLEFIEEQGYERPELWLSDGWKILRAQAWAHPLFWEKRDGEWQEMTLSGMHPLAMNAPAACLSYYEADAFARWAGERLPREEEWEEVAGSSPVGGNFVETGALRPLPAKASRGDRADSVLQLFGDLWEWTASSYLPYPGFRPLEGVLGEYNGKFMCNQMVLRGGSCATPIEHIRPTYRNFFQPEARWQFSGIRLAKSES